MCEYHEQYGCSYVAELEDKIENYERLIAYYEAQEDGRLRI